MKYDHLTVDLILLCIERNLSQSDDLIFSFGTVWCVTTLDPSDLYAF